METDLHLLARYRRHGDAEAFQRLVQSHAGLVHATASRVTQDAALAQDVAQETFLALARSGGAAIQSVGAWLHHVAWQKARDVVRGESRRRSYEAAAAEHLHELREEAAWAELEPLLDEALEELPAATREILIERFLLGRTQQEVAGRRGLSQSTVSRLLTSAVDELRDRLKAKGVVCGSGLAVLLGAHGVQAAPAAVTAALGKLALSGVGVAVPTLTLTQIITSLFMKTLASKVTLAGAALLLVGGAAYDLGSADPRLLRLTKSSKVDRAATAAAKAEHEAKERARDTAAAKAASRAEAPPSGVPAASHLSVTAPAGDTPEVRLSKLARLTKAQDFVALMKKLFASGDPAFVSSELQRLLGLTVSASDLTSLMKSPQTMEFGVLSLMGRRHPREALGWIAMMEKDSYSSMSYGIVFRAVFTSHPEIRAEEMAATLPAGPTRELVLSMLRAQQDPVGEGTRILSAADDEATRQRLLRSLSEQWPKDRIREAAAWAEANLTGKDRHAFLPRMVHYLRVSDPDQALAMMRQIDHPDMLTTVLLDSLHGLVRENRRVADVLPLLDKLQGKQRALAIAEISRRWVRVDQDGLMQWINGLESAADFEAALPLTLPQLTPDHYTKAMDTLMTQVDGTLETALIKAAMTDLSGASHISMDIVQRLTQLPQYSHIGSGQAGNQDLLWQAVNQTAGGWVTQHGAQAAQGARWIDSLTFNSPADRAVVAGRLYEQWKISDPAAAGQWAVRAGVKVP